MNVFSKNKKSKFKIIELNSFPNSGKYIELESLSIKATTEAIQKAANQQWLEKDKVTFPLADSVQQYLQLYNEIING